MASQWPIITIVPTIPSMHLDKRLEDDKDYGLTLFKPNMDTCMKWLDTKEIGSVAYISFGSLATLGEEQMEEITWGLKNSNCHFLWVVRESEVKKLPINFQQETTEKGLIVSCVIPSQNQLVMRKIYLNFLWTSTLHHMDLFLEWL